MAVLSTEDRAAVRKTITDLVCNARDPLAVTKAQFQATVNALDDYVDTNATAINNAIPATPRAALTSRQKALCLAYVCLKRYGVI